MCYEAVALILEGSNGDGEKEKSPSCGLELDHGLSSNKCEGKEYTDDCS